MRAYAPKARPSSVGSPEPRSARRPDHVSVLLLMGVFAGAAQGDVTNVTAANSSVSQASGARTVYTIGFTAGTTLSSEHGTTSRPFPNNTDVTKIFAIDIRTAPRRSATSAATRPPASTPRSLTCNIFNGSVVNPGDTVTTTLDEVSTRPPTLATRPLGRRPLSDTAAVSSAATPNYQVVGQNPVTNVTAANNQVSQALGARTVYTIGFKTSSTGGLAGDSRQPVHDHLPEQHRRHEDLRDRHQGRRQRRSATSAATPPPASTHQS